MNKIEFWINFLLRYETFINVFFLLIFFCSFLIFVVNIIGKKCRKKTIILSLSILSLGLTLTGYFVKDKILDKVSIYEKEIQEKLVDDHYILPKSVKTNVESKISIKKLGKDGTIYFSVEMNGDYIEGNMNKDTMKCQIVNEENINIPNILKCLSEHNVSLYSFDFTGVPTGVLFPPLLHFDIEGLEGITTDNQLVKVECNDKGEPVLTIDK